MNDLICLNDKGHVNRHARFRLDITLGIEMTRATGQLKIHVVF